MFTMREYYVSLEQQQTKLDEANAWRQYKQVRSTRNSLQRLYIKALFWIGAKLVSGGERIQRKVVVAQHSTV